MKVSKVTLESVKKSLRIDYDYDNELLLEIMESARGHLISQTGLSAEEIDAIPEMVYAFKCICGSMYSSREMTAENIKPNPTAEGIIAEHRSNYR